MIRMKRKTISIEITKTAEVLVKAPRQLPLSAIEAFVERRSDWIDQTRQRVSEENRKKEEFDPLREKRLLLLGKEYPVLVSGAPDAAPLFDGKAFVVPDQPFLRLRPGLILLYRQLAAAVITEYVEKYAGIMGVKPASVRITAAKTRWGSCSGKNALCFSWRLIFAEPEALEYVVVHELAHIKEHNHSVRFWRIVSEVLPDQLQRRKLLEQLQRRLAAEQWD